MRSMLVLAAALFAAASPIATASAAETPIVRQKDKVFSTGIVTAPVGNKVRFVNDDTVAHNVMVNAPDGQSTPGSLQKPGEQVEVGFDQAGDHEVRCAIHPKMKMTVRVQ
jgi:plastocyanin